MSLYTDELKLRITDMTTDGEDFFDFDLDLNENFRKIDEFAREQRLNGLVYEKIKNVRVSIPVIGGETKYEDVDVDYYETKQID